MRNPRSIPCLTIALSAVLGACPGAAFADAPQFTVAAASYVFNTHSQNWACDGQSEISPPTKNCHSPYPPASYTFAHHGHITQNPNTGAYVWIMDGGARDGGFENRVGDTLTTFAAQGAQGGTHLLRKTSVEPPELAAYHWEPFSTLYDPVRGKFVAFVSITDSGNLPLVKVNFLLVGESTNGVDNFTWTKVYESRRPEGGTSGTGLLFNNDRYIVDPNDPGRWIGLLGWGEGPLAGTAPTYIDMDRGVFGVLFQNEGWCEYPLGHLFDSYDPSATCASQSSALPDLPYGIPGFFKATKALALVDGKAIVLFPEQTAQACADTDNTCIDSRTPCPPGQDRTLYRTRRNDPGWGFGMRWWVRELSLETWNTSLAGAQWTGPAKLILDGAQPGQFKINSSDIAVGGYDAELKQFADNRVYLYLSIKHSLCLPESNPLLNSWNRFPGTSGTSMMWFRLSY
jgi:hypothetical protein